MLIHEEPEILRDEDGGNGRFNDSRAVQAIAVAQQVAVINRNIGKILPIRIFDAFANSLAGIIETPIRQGEEKVMERSRG